MPSAYSRRFVNIIGDLSTGKMPNGLYKKSLKWSNYKIKLELRKLLIKYGLLDHLKKFKFSNYD